MNLYIGLVIAILGLVVATLGFTGILPNMGSSGIFLILLAGLVIGLSFVPKPESDDSEPMPIWERLIKMFFSPSEVFTNIRRHPNWLIVVLVTAIFSAGYTVAFFQRVTPEVITNQTMTKLSESGFVDEEQLSLIKQQTLEVNSNPIKPLGDFINSFVVLSFLVAFLGLIIFVGALAFGGKIKYLQAISIVAFSMFPVTVIQKVLSTVILFLKDPSDIHPILGQTTLVTDSLNFLVSAGNNPVVYTVLSTLSLLMFYWVWLMSLGLRKGGEKVSSSVSWIIPIFIWLVFLTIGVIGAVLFGSLMG